MNRIADQKLRFLFDSQDFSDNRFLTALEERNLTRAQLADRENIDARVKTISSLFWFTSASNLGSLSDELRKPSKH